MAESEEPKQEMEPERFFTDRKKKEDAADRGDEKDDGEGSIDGSDDQTEEQGQCLTLRFLQRLMPCLEKKSIWDASQGDVEKSHEVEETKYPIILKILESKIVDIIFVFSCLASGMLFFFSEGFVLRNLTLSGAIHTVNTIYTLGLFGQWLRILIESKYSKTNQGYAKIDVVLSLISVFPSDLIVLAIYTINDRPLETPGDRLVITLSRLNYLIRLYYAQKHLSIWEDQLVLGDFKMFIIRLLVYVIFFVHMFGCLFHRVACIPFTSKHFRMTPQEAATDVCAPNSWVLILLGKASQLRNYPADGSVLFNHYLASIYWVINTSLRYGDGDIDIHLTSLGEVIFTAATQIISWIFTLCYLFGTLTSLLIERDTERESYQNRRFAIKQYLDFSYTGRSIAHDVRNFYDFLWERRKGVLHLELIHRMPPTMTAEVFYDVNKFVIGQLPLLSKMDDSVLMKLAIRMKHSFRLEGEVLFRKGEPGRCLYYVLKGYLEVMSEDQTISITDIKQGSAIGEMYLMHPYPHSATVRCGSQCDILVLHRHDFREVISIYPDLWDTMNLRVANRLNQSEILLSLAEKRYNGYISAFGNIGIIIKPVQYHEQSNEADIHPNLQIPSSHNLGEILSVRHHHHESTRRGSRGERMTITDPDQAGLTGLTADQFRRFSVAVSRLPENVSDQIHDADEYKFSRKPNKQRRRHSLEEIAYSTLEGDINGANKLASDLGLLSPPITVAVPNHFSKQQPSAQDINRLLKKFFPKIQDRSFWHIIWMIWITICIFANVFMVTYMIAFRQPNIVFLSYIAHVFDFFVLLDFLFDMFENVVTPRKLLETKKEIVLYKIKTWTLYLRIFGFFPWEYIIAESAGWNWRKGEIPWFYILKFNRVLDLIVVTTFFNEIESSRKIPVLPVVMFRFGVILISIIHLFAIGYEFLLRDWTGKGLIKYYLPFYWSTQALTSTGFGDFATETDAEIITLTFALIVGTAFVTYMGAKVAALLTNSNRRRSSFKHMYYSLIGFMTQRKFPRPLIKQVTQYFRMQWTAHEGVMIPTGRSIIWDAPKSIVVKVTTVQALRFISRIPLAQYAASDVQTQLCKALRRYFVPPREVILNPGDLRRELYIIVKGYCEVFDKENNFIGTLSEGNYFGLPGLLYGVNKEYRIVTETHCQFFCLLYEDFLELTERNKSLGIDYRFLQGLITLSKRKSRAESQVHSRKSIQEQKISEAPSASIEETEINSDQQPIMDSTEPGAKVTSSSEIAGVNQISDTLQKSSGVSVRSVWSRIGSGTGGWMSFLNSLLCCFKFTLTPNGKRIQYWEIFRTLAAVLITIIVFAQAAFAFHPTVSFCVVCVFDIIAWVDIYMMFYLSYYDDYNQPVTKVSKTIKNYLTGPFALDLIACFPFEIFVLIGSPSSITQMFSPGKYSGDHGLLVISYIRLNRMLQIYRLFTAWKFLDSKIFRSLTFVTLVEVVPMLFIFINTMSCIAFLIFCNWNKKGTNPITCTNGSWIANFKPFHPDKSEEGWITKPNYNLGPVSYYIISLYWVTQSAFRVGFGDFDLEGEANIALGVVVILTGLVVTTYLGGKLTASSSGKDSRRVAVQEEMHVLLSFMNQYCVSQSVQRRVLETYFYNWEKTAGVSPSEFLVKMHPNLKAEAATHLYEHTLTKCPLLKDLDEAGIRMLASKLKEVFYPEGEYIMRFGDLNDDFFLINNGIIVCYKENGEIINRMGPGSLIGEISAILGVRRVFSAVAATNVDMFVFDRADFLDFLYLYPDLALKLELACLDHYRDSIQMSKVKMPAGIHFHSEATVAPGEDDAPTLQTTPQIIIHEPDPPDLERGEGRKAVHISEMIETRSDTHVRRLSEQSRDSVNSAEGEERTYWGEDMVGSYINLTQQEAVAKHPEFITDPLRVTLKIQKDLRGDSRASIMQNSSKKQWTPGFRFLTFGRIPKNEMGLLHIYQERRELKFPNIIIHPASPLCSSALFVCLYLLITTLSCSIAAFEVSFRLDYHSRNQRIIILTIRFMVELFFVVRFVGNFFLGYYDEDGILVTKMYLIFKRYLRRYDGLVLDVVTTFPFNFFELLPAEYATDSVYSLSSALLALKLLRFLLFLRYLRETSSDLRIKVSLIKVIKISIVLGFIFHFCACVWYFMACYGFNCTPGSWAGRAIERFIHDKDKSGIRSTNQVTINHRYFLSLYYVTTVITFTGLNDIEPSTLQEICLSIFLMFATIFVIGYLVGEMTQCYASQIARKIHYQHQLAVLEEHFLALGLSNPKLKEVRKYYKTLWLKSKGILHHELFHKLPYPLRADISYEIYGPCVKSCRIFGKVDETINREMCARIRHEFYIPGAHIIRAGEICESMYVIKKGEVVILDENQNLEICVEVLYENECFGEVKLLLPREQYHFSYIARLETEVGVFHREDFEEIFENYPSLKAELQLRAQKLKQHRTKQKDQEEGKLEVRQETDTDPGPPNSLGLPSAPNIRKASLYQPGVEKMYEGVARLSIHGGPIARRMRLHSQAARKTIDEKAFDLAKRGSNSSHSSLLR